MPRGQSSGFMDRAGQGLRGFLFHSKFFPIIFLSAFLGVLLVLFRMKSVEQDYSINNIDSETREISYTNKDLKAKKASRLSVKNLQTLAKKYNLESPKQKQIIVIP